MARTSAALSRGNVGGMTAPARKAELLFETSTIAEIREVETKAKAEIEEKRGALRHLVGNSYRDLISSADTILAMANTCAAAVENVIAIQGGLSRLAASSGSADVAISHDKSAAVSDSKQKDFYALGGLVKFLVDTPEALWGHLDGADFLRAACHFLRAQQVHISLQTPAVAERMRHFPLLRTHWPLVAKFRGGILDGIRRQLAGSADVSATAVADGLAAAALLQDLSSQQALELYLSMRLELLRTQLVQPGDSFDEMLCQLAAIATNIQDTISQVGDIFLAKAHAKDAPPLLPAAVAAEAGDGCGSELPTAEALGDKFSPAASEAQLWEDFIAGAMARVQPLGQEAVAAQAEPWLQDAAAVVAAASAQLLAPANEARQLVGAESAARASLSSWGTNKPGGWNVIAETVLGQNFDVWGRVFEPAFAVRSQALIAASFAEANTFLYPRIDAALEAATTVPAAPAGNYCSGTWGPPRTYSAAEPVPHTSDLQRSPHNGWRREVEEARVEYNARLAAALEGALLLSRPPVPAADKEMFVRPSGRGLKLQPFVQDRCLEAGTAAAEKLRAALDDVTSDDIDSSEGDAARRAEAVLAVAALSSALADNIPMLQVIMSDPSSWQHEGRGVTSAPAALIHQQNTFVRKGATKAAPLQQALRSTAASAFDWWAAWAATAISADMASALSADVALTSTLPLRGWQETIVPGDEDSGEMKFLLPTSPSPALFTALLAAAREADRPGVSVTRRPALELLTWHLSARCLEVFRRHSQRQAGGIDEAKGADAARQSSEQEEPSEQQPTGEKSSERGILQLLLDCTIARHVLDGGQPMGSFQEASSSTAAGRSTLALPPDVLKQQQQWAEVQDTLQGGLDPIDWATYEPHIAGNAAAFCQRSGVLLGVLLHLTPQGTKTYGSGLAKTTSSGQVSGGGGDSNIVAVASAAERFAYLPVSIPAAAQAALRKAAGTPATLFKTTGQGMDDDDETYSFADLSSATSAFGLESSTSPHAPGSASEEVQSRAGARLGAFGSLLGDKAAEAAGTLSDSLSVSLASAAGSTGLGNYLQPVAASSLLSSFRSRWQAQ